MPQSRFAVALLVVLACLPGANASGATAPQALEATKGEPETYDDTFLGKLCERLDADAPQALASLDLEPPLPPAQAHERLVDLGQQALDANLAECAHPLLLDAERRMPGDVDLAMMLAWLERYLDKPESAAARAAFVAGKDFSQFEGHDDWLYGLIDTLPYGSPARIALLQALFDARWDPLPPGASELWFQLVEARLADDDIDGARAALERITSPSVIARLRIDRRFDAIVDRTAARFDLRQAGEAELATLRARAARAPRLLETHVAIVSTLLELGRAEEALAEVAAMEIAAAAATVAEAAFDDADQMVWLRNHRTIALRRLGRIDDAVAALEAASRMTENGHVNVSQALNLAAFLNRLGRGAEARQALARVGEDLSGYGRMVQMQEKMHAALLAGDQAGADAALAYLLEHADDSPQIARSALVDMDRLDDAAARLVADLAAPETRADALLDLQDFKAADPLPADVERIARWKRLLARADVRAVIDQVGRLESYDVHRWGDMD